ncbi:M48 family metallopeptidase [Candidatus Ozemobacteraceae bacterium]|nr:M48 family metallopeptidase [Candidatus Ozemobacteraceae bacterium]
MIYVPYLGNRLALEVRRTPFADGRLIEHEGVIRAGVPASVPDDRLKAEVRRMVENWLRAQAGRVLGERVRDLCRRHGLSIGTVTIKDTRSRWGSCSVRRNLNFNWRLVMAPPWVIDYLVVHETAHLDEMNHSDRFWRLVAQRCPDYRSHEAWLKTCGASLLSW